SVALHCNDIGVLARRDRAHTIFRSDIARGVDSCCLDRTHRRHSVLDHVRKLTGVLSVWIDSGVGSVGYLYPRGYGFSESVALSFGGLIVLAKKLLGVAEPPVFGCNVVAVEDVSDKKGSTLFHQPNAFVVDQRTVLD